MAQPIHAAPRTIVTVANTNDSGAGSLRDAIANAFPNDTIVFSLTLPATITLASELEITQSLIISGPGASLLTLNGNNSTRVFSVTAGVALDLSSLTLANGLALADNGGAIRNDGALTVSNTVFNSNTAASDGGAISNRGMLTVTGVSFSGNHVSGSGAGCFGGGAICNNLGTAIIANSIFSGNLASRSGGLGISVGGGIANSLGFLAITNTAFWNDQAGGGGAIANSGTASIANASFSINQAGIGSGGAINNTGSLNISGSSFSNNNISGNFSGGGIYNTGSLTVTRNNFNANRAFFGGGIMNQNAVTIAESTFSGNLATFGAGVENTAMGNIVNSTFFSNTASSQGGGIYNSGLETSATLTLTNATFSKNSAVQGGALYVTGTATTTLRNTIVANSTSGGNCAGAITDGSGNLSYPDSTCPGINSDPKLGVLANYGGATPTMGLLAGSPALNAATAANCPATDQRGVYRLLDGMCDIGAVEGVVYNYLMPLIFR